ncbi:MAG: hypothetical protein RKO25_05045 [Candidatus Contendobacter sp.]|nr:hypothetical protein [Candidatus Contendobacter sp.]
MLVLIGLGIIELLLLSGQSGEIPILIGSSNAQWIKEDTGVYLHAWTKELHSISFKRKIEIENRQSSIVINIKAYQTARIYLNGDLVSEIAGVNTLIASSELDLTPYLKERESNDLLVVVSNNTGPPALFIDSVTPVFRTDENWQVSSDGELWRSARNAASVEHSKISEQLIPPWMAFVEQWKFYTILFILGSSFAMGWRYFLRGKSITIQKIQVGIVGFRWILITGTAILFLQNFILTHYLHFPIMGMDLPEHFRYIQYIVERHQLPLATDGLQMFQPPLAYILNAQILKLIGVNGIIMNDLGVNSKALYLVDAITMLVSLGSIYFSCRMVELAFTHHAFLKIGAMTIAATLPASIYMAHNFGNEPYFAFLGTLLLYLWVHVFTATGKIPERKEILLFGIVCGLALLAKTSAAIMVLVLMIVIWYQQRRNNVSITIVIKQSGWILGCIVLVCGWWYLRNLVLLGKPFIGGWEAGRGFDWWQYPGYRVPEHLFRFGEALVYPYCAGISGFWDGLYSSLWGDGFMSSITDPAQFPKWNIPAMQALYIQALLVSIAIIVGVGRALIASPEAAIKIPIIMGCAGLIIAFVGAVFHLYATIPIFTAVKGSYLMALAPCLGILAAWGIEPWTRNTAAKVIVSGFLAVWVGSVWSSFLIALR